MPGIAANSLVCSNGCLVLMVAKLVTFVVQLPQSTYIEQCSRVDTVDMVSGVVDYLDGISGPIG